MHIKIHTAAIPDGEAAISNDAAAAVRMGFNPSRLPDVDTLKAIAAAFISECERLSAANPDAGRAFAVAKTEMQTASMWAVSGATKGL